MPEPVTIIAAITAAAAVAGTAYGIVSAEDAKSRQKKALAKQKTAVDKEFRTAEQLIKATDEEAALEKERIGETKKLQSAVLVGTGLVAAAVVLSNKK